MSTSELIPPPEAVGPLGQLGDAGGGIVPALAPAPVPYAVSGASPGLATSATAPPIAPTLPSDDPASMALLIARLAGELLGGTSLSPAPMAPLPAATAAAATPAATPGIAPQLIAPTPPDLAGGAISPALVASPPAAPPAPAPPISTPSALPTPFGPPSFTALLSPALPTSPPPSIAAIDAPTSPFGTPSFDSVLAASPGLTDLYRLPIVDDLAIDGLPSYLPAAGAVGLEQPPELAAPDVRAPDKPIRDLGGNAFDPYAIRRDFPILEERVHGKRLIWLDNGATTQKPRAVIDRVSYFYEHENSNIHRAAHTLAARATDAYEGGRAATRRYLNAGSTDEIIFVRGATEGINLIAQSWGRRFIGPGDEIVLTWLEHHANIVPWQQLCAETGARLRIAPVDDRGDVILEAYERLLGSKTKLVAFTQVSNALGTVTPAREMTAIAHRHGACVLVDGAQAVSHMRVDVQELDCDFYVFSGHKVFAPTGIGAVYGKRAVLESMPPWQGGGNMIRDVTFERTSYQPPPGRFEAGTGSIADAVGLGAALDYVSRIGLETIARYEHDLLVYATRRLETVPGLRIIGRAIEKAGVLSFVLDGQRTEDVGAALDKEGIAVRSGHHCAQPILRRFGLESSVRASLAFYNVCEDIDALVEALHRLQAGRG